MQILKATVINCLIAKTKWGPKTVLNAQLISDKSKVACWSDPNNPLYLSKKPGDIVELIQDAKGKFSLLDREETPSPTPITMSRPSSNGSEGSHYTYNSSNNLESELSLPTPMNEADKKKLALLIKERAKLLTYTIEVMRDELNTKGLEFHEGSLRSLGVSLFIHISRHLD